MSTLARFTVVSFLVLTGCDSAPSKARPAAVSTDRVVSAPMAPSQARSLIDNKQLRWPLITAEARAKMEMQLAEAQARFDAYPANEQNIIWLGRRLAYLGRISDAIRVYTEGLAQYPRSVELLRHRGHRYITVRNFEAAWADLLAAAQIIRDDELVDEVEPDGQPNPQNKPRSTLHSNVYYHLALCAYLRGDFAQAASIWDQAMQDLTMNDDNKVSFAYWRYLSLLRINSLVTAQEELAFVTPDLDVIENHAYFNLLLVFRGLKGEQDILKGVAPGSVDEATMLYGLAVRCLASQEAHAATGMMERVVAGGQWPAFGAIAAEADLARAARSHERLTSPPTARDMADEQIRDINRQRRGGD